MAAKKKFGGSAWFDWPDVALRRHEAAAVETYREMLGKEIEYEAFVQYLFFRQWQKLRNYAGEKGIKILGDLPIYVSLDSADVWSEGEQFLLDGEGKPREVAGVPPDYFSQEGQLWGNPLYDWDYMRRDGFGWWMRRMEGAIRLVDAVRIGHFRGLECYRAIPAQATSAKIGQ